MALLVQHPITCPSSNLANLRYSEKDMYLVASCFKIEFVTCSSNQGTTTQTHKSQITISDFVVNMAMFKIRDTVNEESLSVSLINLFERS